MPLIFKCIFWFVSSFLAGGGIIKQWTGRKCSVEGCNFELCLYSVGQPERTFPLCPNCFNNPRPEWGRVPGDEDSSVAPKVDSQDVTKERQIRRVGGKSLILECPLPDNHPLISEMSVSPDPDSDGVFILDPHFGPKWRLVSTREYRTFVSYCSLRPFLCFEFCLMMFSSSSLVLQEVPQLFTFPKVLTK